MAVAGGGFEQSLITPLQSPETKRNSVERTMQRRYQSLQLHDAISRRNDYVEACKELQGVLKAVYVGVTKAFQGVLYEDVVHAFRTLPGMENTQQLEAAKSLLQTVQDIFPKQRRAAAAHEYKIAIIAWHRQCRSPEALPECLQLSGDTLLHVFEYLDARSLAIASAVCRAWNVAATDDTLWRTQFLSLFGTSNLSLNLMNVAGIRDAVRKPDQVNSTGQVLQKPPDNSVGAWRKAFNLAQKGRSSQLFMSNRAYCPVCKAVIWLVDPPWKPVKGKCVARKQILDHHSPRPMSVSQVVRYVVSRDTASASESSSSDSDEDDDSGKSFFRLWNVPRCRED